MTNKGESHEEEKIWKGSGFLREECSNKELQTEELMLVAQSCPTLFDPTDSSPSGRGILQARILDWVAMPWRNLTEMYHLSALWGEV